MTQRILSQLKTLTATQRLGAVSKAGLERNLGITLVGANNSGTSPTCDVSIEGGVMVTGGTASIAGTVVDTKLKSGATTNVRLGAKWTQSGTQSLYQVGLILKKTGTLAAGKTLTLTIEGDSSGPDGSALATVTADIDTEVGSSYAVVWFILTDPINLTDSTDYWITLTADYTASATNCVTWKSETVGSGGNGATHNDTSWTVAATLQVAHRNRDISFSSTGISFTQLDTTDSIERKTAWADDLPEYLSATATLAGTSPSYDVAIMIDEIR